jgi:hypothetical protein
LKKAVNGELGKNVEDQDVGPDFTGRNEAIKHVVIPDICTKNSNLTPPESEAGVPHLTSQSTAASLLSTIKIITAVKMFM